MALIVGATRAQVEKMKAEVNRNTKAPKKSLRSKVVKSGVRGGMFASGDAKEAAQNIAAKNQFNLSLSRIFGADSLGRRKAQGSRFFQKGR